MNLKKSLSNALKKSSETAISTSIASLFGYGLEDMPESLKKTR